MSEYIINEQSVDSNELYHYGVLGMKWGIRRANRTGGSYSYKSHSTKKWEKRANKYAAKSKKYESTDSAKSTQYKAASIKATKIAKRSSTHDARMLDIAKKSNVGGVVATNLIFGLWGNKTYSSIRASGGSLEKAAVATVLNSALGTGPITAAVVKSKYIRNID